MTQQANIPERSWSISPDLSASEHAQRTFRDPAGQLYLKPDVALRRIRPAAVEQTIEFLSSPLRSALELGGELIRTEILETSVTSEDPATVSEPGEMWLRHPRINPITYPWEWTPAQWRSAAQLTLRIAGNAIDAGWTLKDATPLNIQFSGAQPILVDVLSFERRDPNAKTWLAYGQFVRTFLLPLIAEQLLGWPLQSSQFARDGYEPRTIYDALRPWQRLRPGLFDVVTLAAIFEGKPSPGSRPQAAQPKADPSLVTHILQRRILRLGNQIESTSRGEPRSQWSEYEKTSSHYTAVDRDAKQDFVARQLGRLRPKHVLDIGANTGVYSRMAADTGAAVTAIDSDPAAVEALFRRAQREDQTLTALVANIARPTPALGWKNQEQLSLLERLKGQFDLVLMLAVIHHLILREQIPLGHIGDLCRMLTRRWLILEWVPPRDPMFQEWLRGREELYGGLKEDDLIQAFKPFFTVNERCELANGRVLVLFRRHPSADAGSDAWHDFQTSSEA